MLVGSLPSCTYTFGDGDFDFYVLSSSSDHEQISNDVYRSLLESFKNGSYTRKENGQVLLNFILDGPFRGTESVDVTTINVISPLDDQCRKDGSARVYCGKAITYLKKQQWTRTVTSKELLQEATKMLKFTVKAIVPKKTKPPGFLLEFIALMSDRCNGVANDTVPIILEKLRNFLVLTHPGEVVLGATTRKQVQMLLRRLCNEKRPRLPPAVGNNDCQQGRLANYFRCPHIEPVAHRHCTNEE